MNRNEIISDIICQEILKIKCTLLIEFQYEITICTARIKYYFVVYRTCDKISN